MRKRKPNPPKKRSAYRPVIPDDLRSAAVLAGSKMRPPASGYQHMIQALRKEYAAELKELSR